MSDGPKYRDEEWLREQYWENEKTTADMAAKCCCSPSTIRRWMDRFGIDRQQEGAQSDERLNDRDWLENQYVRRQKSIYDIAEELNCSPTTVNRWLEKNEIPRRDNARPASEELTDEGWLREKYKEKMLSTREIAAELGTDRSTVSRWLSRHGIETRGNMDRVPEKLRDRDWLEKKYTSEKKRTKEIADVVGCSPKAVLNALKRHGIDVKRRNRGGHEAAPKADRDRLREEYVKKQRNMGDIAEDFGVSTRTVSRWLSKHDIKTRGNSHINQLKDRGWLYERYRSEGLSTTEISNMLGCSQTAVWRSLKKHGITTRPHDAAGERNRNWNGGPQPYGTGWNAKKRRQVRERDGHECVDCGTTQTEHKTEYGEKLHVHHLIKARDIDDPEERNAPENLITLCRDCHREWERLSEAGIRPQIDGVTAD